MGLLMFILTVLVFGLGRVLRATATVIGLLVAVLLGILLVLVVVVALVMHGTVV